MSAVLDLSRREEWTPEALAAMLSEPGNEQLDWRRFEILDGALVVTPPAGRPHEHVVARLILALGPVVPEGYSVIAAAGVDVGRSYRITDVTVLTTASVAAPEPALTARDVLIAIEIESPNSITEDRITKLAQYAAAGVQNYWRVETDPLRLVAYRLTGDVYAEVGSWTGLAHVEHPFPVDVDVPGLLPA